MGKPEAKGPLGARRSRWEDNISMKKWDGRAWTGLIWLRIGSTDGLL
jgi:hypothetical protein